MVKFQSRSCNLFLLLAYRARARTFKPLRRVSCTTCHVSDLQEWPVPCPGTSVNSQLPWHGKPALAGRMERAPCPTRILREGDPQRGRSPPNKAGCGVLESRTVCIASSEQGPIPCVGDEEAIHPSRKLGGSAVGSPREEGQWWDRVRD